MVPFAVGPIPRGAPVRPGFQRFDGVARRLL